MKFLKLRKPKNYKFFSRNKKKSLPKDFGKMKDGHYLGTTSYVGGSEDFTISPESLTFYRPKKRSWNWGLFFFILNFLLSIVGIMYLLYIINN
jgi:hypothetical protein